MILRGTSLLCEKEPPDRFIGSKCLRSFEGRCRENRTSKQTVHIGNWTDDAVGDLVLKFEDALLLPISLECLGPKMFSRFRVHQAHGDPQFVPRLAQTSLHKIARTKFVADLASRYGFGEIVRRRIPCDHPEIRKTREAGDDLFIQPFCECRDLRIATEFEWQHRCPKPFSAARIRIRWVSPAAKSLAKAMESGEQLSSRLRPVGGIDGQHEPHQFG